MRAGVVVKCGDLYGFSYNPSTKNITDFGGRSEEDEYDSLVVAKREWFEESLGIFSNYNISDTDVKIETPKTTLYIVTVDNRDHRYYTDKLDKRISKEPKSETLGLIWLTSKQVKMLISEDSGKIFKKIVPALSIYFV